MPEIAIALLPLMLLVVALLFGHYPGCDAIVRFAERIGSRLQARTTKSQPRPRAPRVSVASGGLLIALGVASRPPPLLA
jgi:hypothetical protein